MPYMSDSRSRGEYPQSGYGDVRTPYAHVSYTGHDSVYSFRTGKRARSVKLDSADIYLPPQGSTVLSAMVYRKKFIERELSKAITSTSTGAPTHFLLGDLGHEFATAKTRFAGTTNRLSYLGDQYSGYAHMTNVIPRNLYTLNRDGVMVLTTSMTDTLDGYFSSKGFPYSTQGSSFGPTMMGLQAEATNHIKTMNPHQQKASVLASLLELARGDIPGLLADLRKHFTMISRMKASGLKDASQALGSEWLNNQFGWTPILSDVNAATKVLTTLDSLLFPEDNTRRVVKRILHSRAATQSGTGSLTTEPPLRMNGGLPTRSDYASVLKFQGTTNFQAGPVEMDYTASEVISLWTTARFNTGPKPSTANNGYLDKAIELLGLELNANTLWELTPWSWLIDWFSNIGTVIENLTSLGLSNTILNYAYTTMRREAHSGVVARPAEVHPLRYYSITSVSGDFIYSWRTDQKVRLAASPFGFDVSLDVLNPGQWGILVALGLARSR